MRFNVFEVHFLLRNRKIYMTSNFSIVSNNRTIPSFTQEIDVEYRCS